MSAREERKLVTVLFADLVGSTAYAGDRDPERVRALLDRFYQAMRGEIERTGGTIEKFAGDAVMAVFGAPAALEDHAERALHAALAMQDRMRELFGDELEMRIGVNTGDVVVGTPQEGGSSFVTGDAVNVADRLQKAAESGQVLAGERTVSSAEGAFEFGDRRTVEAKGKAGGITCRPVVRALTLVRPRGLGGTRHAFVGRGSELELLSATYRRAASQEEPHLVTIVGEPGIGKTRLVGELEEAVARESTPPKWRTGRCLAYGDGITYWPVAELLREHFAIREGDSREEIMGRLDGQEALGLALGLDVAGDMHPLEAKERLHEAVVAFAEGLAADQPAVVLIEDVHWAESDLLDLLERIVDEARAALLVVTTARPELFDARPTWGAGKRNASVVRLDPLQEADALRLLDALAPLFPEGVRALVVDRADGNPFFLEELVGGLIDAGTLDWSAVATSAGLDADLKMPDTVYAALAARIDRLPATEKAGLQAGAVVGRVFWPSPVVHLLDGEQPDFGLLEERDLIRRSRSSSFASDREYAMKHALTREVAYATIPKARRGRLHAALAEWLERSELGSDDRAPLLAYHYSQAVEPENADLVWAGEEEELERLRVRAVHWLRRAGRLARARYEMDEVVELLTRAVELSDDEHERAILWREIGESQALRYDGEAFWEAMEHALDGPLDARERADAYSVLAFQTSIRSGMWRVRPSREMIENWVDRALELSAVDSLERARALLARVQADPIGAPAELLDEVTETVTRHGDDSLRSFAYGAWSSAAFEHLRFVEAATWSKRRLELMRDLDDPDNQCEAYEDSVPLVAAIGSFDEARRLADEYWSIARRLSAHHRVHAASLRLELADLMGDWAAIADETDRVTELVTDNLATPCVRNSRDLLLCAAAHLVTGDEERARALEREADVLAGEGFESELSTPRLRLALTRGDIDGIRGLVRLPPQRRFVWGASAFTTLLDARVVLREHDWIEREAPPLAESGTVTEPFALRALGAARNDDDLLAAADRRFRELGLEWHRTQTERLLAGL